MRRLQRGVELRKKEDIKLVETQMHLIRAPNAREREPEEEVRKAVVEEMDVEMDVEMENLEAKMQKESTPSSSKASVRRQKILAKL